MSLFKDLIIDILKPIWFLPTVHLGSHADVVLSEDTALGDRRESRPFSQIVIVGQTWVSS